MTAVSNISWNDNEVKLSGTSRAPIITSPYFNIPQNIKVCMTTTGILEARAAKPVLKCLISGTEVIYKKSSKTYNSEDFNERGKEEGIPQVISWLLGHPQCY